MGGPVYTNGISGVVNVGVSPGGNRIAYATSSMLSVVDRVAGMNWTIGSLAATAHPGLRFSADGSLLVYVARVSNTNQVYLYDLENQTNFLVSHSYSSSAGACGASDWPEISADGRFVAYRSAAGNIVFGDTNGLPDVFLYDRLHNSTTLLSVNRFGTSAGDNRSLAPLFSGDSQSLVFESGPPIWRLRTSTAAVICLPTGSEEYLCSMPPWLVGQARARAPGLSGPLSPGESTTCSSRTT